MILKDGKILLLSLFVVAIAAVFISNKWGALETATETRKEISPKTTQPQKFFDQEGKVIYVVDGDTVELETGQRVRLVGIDAPESEEPYFSESRAKLEEMVLNEKVRLERDETDQDDYGRLLRYLYQDELFVNLEMVRLGYAKALVIPPDVKYKDLFLSAASEARRQRLGVWAAADN